MASRRTVVDLSVLACLDMGHRWQTMSIVRETRGRYRGSARRELLCMECGGVKIEHIRYNGTMMARYYKSSKTYIEAARKLGEVHERRREMRRRLLRGT